MATINEWRRYLSAEERQAMSKPTFTKQQLAKRMLDLEDQLHRLMADCDKAGFKKAADAIDYIVSYCTSPVYDELGGAQ